MDWNDVYFFTVLVEAGTLTAAAERLDVQHNTVSRRIAQLERHLEVRLFDRIGKRYLLTDDGGRIYRQAQELRKDMAALQRLAREQPEIRHTVSISAPPLVIQQLVLPHLADFYRRHQQIRLHLQSEAALADLHQRQADIALRLVRPTQNDLAVRRLLDFGYRIYGHRDYLATRNRNTWQFVQITVEAHFARWFSGFIGASADIVFSSNDFTAVKQALSARIGIGILPDFAVSPDDGLQEVPLSGGAPSVFAAELYLVMHDDVRRSPSVRAAADFFGEALGRQAGKPAIGEAY